MLAWNNIVGTGIAGEKGMPTYDFWCKLCKQKIELHIPISGPYYSLVVCPVCNTRLEEIPSAPAFTIKGFNEKNGYGSR